VDGGDFAEEVGGGGGSEDLCEGFLERGADCGFDACWGVWLVCVFRKGGRGRVWELTSEG
jgi:hypothetical protein